MAFRAFIILTALGIFLGMYGWSEFKLSRTASETPEAITIQQLEKGTPANPHRVIGPHQPVYSLVIYSEDQKTKKINYVYYPITSKDRLKALFAALARKKGDPRKVTDQEYVKAIDVKVLVKSSRFRNEKGLKEAIDKETFPTKDVTGMIVNSVESLKTQERDMLKGRFPSFDETKCVIFEIDRKPTSTRTAIACLAGSVALFLLAVFSFVMLRRR